MMSAAHISIAFSALAPGREDDHDKHSEGVRRYRLSEDQPAGMPPSPGRYLTIRELDRPPAEPIRSWAYSRIASVSLPGNDETWSAPHIAVAFSAPAIGRDDDYNRWYDEVHLAEALSLPGHVGAHRYRLSEDQLASMPPSPYGYLAIYELDRPPAEPLAALSDALESGAITLPDSVDPGSLHSWMFSSVSD